MFTKEEIALAKDTVEAIKKIAERQEMECPTCRNGRVPFGVGSVDEKCSRCDGTAKVKGKWEWEPEVGEWCIFQDAHIPPRKKVCLVIRAEGLYISVFPKYLDKFGDYTCFRKPTNCIPLLHWERIEEILEGMGYEVWTDKLKGYVKCRIFRGKDQLVLEQRKTRREAVYAAVIELGKESK